MVEYLVVFYLALIVVHQVVLLGRELRLLVLHDPADRLDPAVHHDPAVRHDPVVRHDPAVRHDPGPCQCLREKKNSFEISSNNTHCKGFLAPFMSNLFFTFHITVLIMKTGRQKKVLFSFMLGCLSDISQCYLSSNLHSSINVNTATPLFS
jgi:hypothetical protein